MTRTKSAAKTEKTKGSWLSLATASLVFIAVAALMGWAGSFIGLHGFGMQRMTGFTQITAWAIPGAYDGAALACTFAVYRASINGRSAARGRVMMFAFTGVSSWVNWTHQTDHTARLVAAGLPIAAVVVFDFLMTELRADWEAAHGRRAFRIRPALLILRYLVDRKGTREAFRQQITAIPVSALAGLGADLAEAAGRESGSSRPGPDSTKESESGPDLIKGDETGAGSKVPDFVPDSIMSLPAADRSDSGSPDRPDFGPAPTLAPVPAPRTVPADRSDSSSEPVSPAPIISSQASVADAVRSVYRDSWDTGTIQRIVLDALPDASPETVRRTIGKVRTESRSKSGAERATVQESGTGGYL